MAEHAQAPADAKQPQAPFPAAPHTGLSRRVFVGNLAFSVTWQDLKDHFRLFGEVVYANVMRGQDNRSKGCGIVEFKTPAEATHAIESLNNTLFRNRQMFCREDREDRELKNAGIVFENTRPPRAERPPAAHPTAAVAAVAAAGQPFQGGNNGGFRGNARFGAPAAPRPSQAPPSPPGTTVYVGNMPFSATEQELRDLFGRAGKIENVTVPAFGNGRPKGFALVTFTTREEAANAVANVNGAIMQERKLEVHVDLKNQ